MDCRFYLKKYRASLTKLTPKGYVIILGVDFESDGSEKLGTIRPAAGPDGGTMAGSSSPRRSSLF